MNPKSEHPMLSPLELGPLKTPNRVVWGAHRTNLAGDGYPGKKLAAYYLARAKGGCGLIVMGELSILPNDRPYEKMLPVYSDTCMESLGRLVSDLKNAGALVVAQLIHRGFQSSGMISRLPLWGPVAMADVVNCELCQEMAPEDLAELPRAFAGAATRLQDIGVDGLEVSIGPHSLLRQFLSPITNQRTDDHGGDLSNRMRMSLEVLQAVRESLSSDRILGVELCLDELFWGGLTTEETLPVAREITRRGLADYFSATVGTYYNLNLAHAAMHHPEGFILDKAAALKNAVDTPVMAGNRVTGPGMARRVLTENQADMIRWVRPLICEPDLVAKLKADREHEIVHCAYDNQDCLGRTARNKPVGCAQNPRAGRESGPMGGPWQPTPSAKRVTIVGAGPAGLMAALAAARQGHQPEVFESEPEPGGQLCLARRGAARSGIGTVVDNLVRRLTARKVPLHYGHEMTATGLMDRQPDVLILATGAYPDSCPIPGEYEAPWVLDVWQVLTHAFEAGDRVLVIDEDGHYRAAATAEYLADQGKKVDMMTSEDFVGPDLASQGDLGDVRTRLHQKGARFFPALSARRIENGGVTAEDKFTGETVQFDAYDTVVLATPPIADDRLYREVKGRLPHIYRAGDCIAPRKAGNAIWEGFQAAWSISRHG